MQSAERQWYNKRSLAVQARFLAEKKGNAVDQTKLVKEKGKNRMNEIFSRSARLLGETALETLAQSTVAVFGVGGVGSYACEALARTGIGSFLLIDNDVVSPSNLNRQLVALHSTIGQQKVAVMRDRILDINPAAQVRTFPLFYTPETADTVPLSEVDYIVDAIDTVSAKLALAERAVRLGVPVISAMGAGNKLNPLGFTVSDIGKTEGCPLARVMRRELRARGISHLKVVWSREMPRKPIEDGETPPQGRRQTPGSLPFVPSVAGLILASEVVYDLTGVKKDK